MLRIIYSPLLPSLPHCLSWLQFLLLFSSPPLSKSSVSILAANSKHSSYCRCCGNEINSSTYNVCCLRVMVGSYLVLSFLVLGLSIGAMIVNSDLQQAVDFTSCNTQNVIKQAYNGNDNNTIPWSGINNFQQDIDIFTINIQDAVPFLIEYFADSSTPYQTVTDQNAGSSYLQSKDFPCQSDTTTTIQCPFPDATDCTTPYNPVFNA